jgi:hypothetical protein
MGRRPAGLVALALLGALAVAGCSAVTELVELGERIERRGYRNVETFHDDFATATNEVQVQASVGRGQEPPDGNDEIAGIVWETYPRRFDSVRVELGGEVVQYSREDLQTVFGPRDERLDEREFSDDVQGGIRTVGIVALAVLAVGGGLLTWFLVRRSRRKRNQPPPWGYGPPPGGYGPPGGWRPPPPPGPPPGWNPPPPPPPPS